MKLVTYQSQDRSVHLGAVIDDRIINLAEASNGQLPDDMRQFLQLGDKGMQQAQQAIASASGGLDRASVKLLPPITDPSKIVAIGLNYMDHIRETGMTVPTIATMFCKYPSSLIGPDETILWNTELTNKVDYEAELALVIGKTARHVSQDHAYDYIAGYTNCNDVSARDLQLETGDQWLRGKCIDTFCPLGPWLVTRDEISDPQSLDIRCLVNGRVLQDSNTREMIFNIPYLIQYLSQAFTLLPGDVIITGTPSGAGAFRQPPLFLQHGDEVSIEIEGIGRLTNRCAQG